MQPYWSFDKESWLGAFARLNIFPKPTYMCTYSSRCSDQHSMGLQHKVFSRFQKKHPDFYGNEFNNLDFHSIPHHGDESEMKMIWCGAKGMTMKETNTIFTSDDINNALVYQGRIYYAV